MPHIVMVDPVKKPDYAIPTQEESGGQIREYHEDSCTHVPDSDPERFRDRNDKRSLSRSLRNRG